MIRDAAVLEFASLVERLGCALMAHCAGANIAAVKHALTLTPGDDEE